MASKTTIIIADPAIPEEYMATTIDTGLGTKEDTDAVMQTAEGIGIRRPMSALLWSCPECMYWNVTTWRNTTINTNLSQGSYKSKLTNQRQQPCGLCGKHGKRLHSMRSSRIIAMIDALKPKQLLNLRATAEELNAIYELTGEVATEHDANKAWFQMNKLLKQGKGRKYWAMPFRRWSQTISRGSI